MSRALTSTLAALVVTASAAARPPGEAGSIRGRVVLARAGSPPAATVRAGDREPVRVDEEGSFLIPDVLPGNVELLVEGPDIEPRRAVVLVPPGGAVTVRLEVAPLYVTVVRAPARAADTASTARVEARALASVPKRTAEDALRLVPGLVLVQHGSEGKGHQFFMRGFDAVHGADLEIRVDGIPANEQSNVHAQGYLDLAFVIPEAIRDVTVAKGPFGLDQGPFGMAGTADYRLGIPDGDLGWRVGYTAGTSNRHRLLFTYSPSDGDGEQLLAVEALHDDGYGENRLAQRAAVLGRVHLFDSERAGRLTLLGAGFASRFGLPGTVRLLDVEEGFLGFHDSHDDGTHGMSARGLGSLRYELLRGAHEVRALAYGGFRRLELLDDFTGWLVDEVHGDRRKQAQDTITLGLSATYGITLHRTLTLHTGAGLHTDLVEQHEDHIDHPEHGDEPDPERSLERRRELEITQHRAHAMVGLRWSPHAALRLDAGARVDAATASVAEKLADEEGGGTRAVVSPRVALCWFATPSLHLFGSYGRGLRPPEARAFTSYRPQQEGIGEERFEEGEPDITVSDAAEVGIRWLGSRYLQIRVSAFATFIERESIYDHVSGINLELNGTRRLGAELVLASRPLDWLTVSADVTYVNARFIESGNTVPLAPWLAGGLHAVATHPLGIRGGLRVIGVAPRPLPHGAEGSGFVSVDVTAGYDWRWLRVGVELENVLGQDLREGEYHFASRWRKGEEPSRLPAIHYVAGPPFGARLTLAAVF